MAKGTGDLSTTVPHLSEPSREFLTHGMSPKSTPGMNQPGPAGTVPSRRSPGSKAFPRYCRGLRSPKAKLSHPKNDVLVYWRFAWLNRSQV